MHRRLRVIQIVRRVVERGGLDEDVSSATHRESQFLKVAAIAGMSSS